MSSKSSNAAAKVNDARARSRLLDAAMPASRTTDSGEPNRLIPRKRILKALIAVHPTGQLLRELPSSLLHFRCFSTALNAHAVLPSPIFQCIHNAHGPAGEFMNDVCDRQTDRPNSRTSSLIPSQSWAWRSMDGGIRCRCLPLPPTPSSLGAGWSS